MLNLIKDDFLIFQFFSLLFWSNAYYL